MAKKKKQNASSSSMGSSTNGRIGKSNTKPRFDQMDSAEAGKANTNYDDTSPLLPHGQASCSQYSFDDRFSRYSHSSTGRKLTMKDVISLPIVKVVEKPDQEREIDDSSEDISEDEQETDSESIPEEQDQHAKRSYAAPVQHDASTVFQDAGEQAVGSTLRDCTVGGGLPRLTGWMHKLSPKWFRGWQPRYFILEDKVLSWFRKESDVVAGRISGAIDLNCVRIEVQVCDPVTSSWACCGRRANPGCTNWGLFDTTSEFKICPVGVDKEFYLRCKGEDAANWIQALSDHQAAVTWVPSIDIIKNQKHIWRVRRIPPYMLEQIVDSGDILLFKSKGGVRFFNKHTSYMFTMIARIQRTFTGGQYDHVALLLKFGNGNIGVLESTGGLGVTVINWKVFVVRKWYELYPCIVLRKLSNVARNQERMQKLERWVRDTIGKPYELTFAKLRGKVAEEDSNGYFCSQVVAKALMEMDVLSTDKFSSKYWPADFSSKKSLPMINDAYFGPELLLDFKSFPPAVNRHGRPLMNQNQRQSSVPHDRSASSMHGRQPGTPHTRGSRV